ncbi:regucalcin-like [Achroia grisella]|uniref:regucalcin-like n=1 Tax=Achroia grisella TaxID=688607 RepID=UPI0027D1F7B0|nr:regucalcin-like [Achroia grisella]
MSVTVEKIVDPVVLGEGPHWDEKQQALFFVSIHDRTIHKYVLSTKEHTKTKLDGPVGFIVPVEGTSDQFVVGVGRKFQVVRWDGRNNSPATVVKEIGEVDQHTNPTTRLNDGKADPRGRLYAGTMGHEEPLGVFIPEQGAFFRLDGSRIIKLSDKIGISNGLTWDLKEKAMYYIDSPELNIRRYDYNVETGEISNMKRIFDFKKKGVNGTPDGMTIDTDGNLWVAVFDGSSILQIDPREGKLLRQISIPAKQVTSVTFGGPNYDILFVTTAKLKINNVEQEPPCGATFKVTGLGVKGFRNNNFKL